MDGMEIRQHQRARHTGGQYDHQYFVNISSKTRLSAKRSTMKGETLKIEFSNVKNNYWVEREDARLRAEAGSLTIAEIAELHGRTAGAIYSRFAKLVSQAKAWPPPDGYKDMTCIQAFIEREWKIEYDEHDYCRVIPCKHMRSAVRESEERRVAEARMQRHRTKAPTFAELRASYAKGIPILGE